VEKSSESRTKEGHSVIEGSHWECSPNEKSISKSLGIYRSVETPGQGGSHGYRKGLCGDEKKLVLEKNVVR